MLVFMCGSITRCRNTALSMSLEPNTAVPMPCEQSMLEGGDSGDASEWERLAERVLQQQGATYKTALALQ